MVNYNDGKVYCIRNHVDDEVYVGSTCQLLSNRMGCHRKRCRDGYSGRLYDHMRAVGVEHFYVELIESCKDCETKEELVARERHHMREIGTLNRNVPGAFDEVGGKKEYFKREGKIRYAKNPEPNKQRAREWYQENKDRALVSSRKWVENNMERVKEYKHSWYESNKDNLQERAREYREANKDRIKEKDKAYYEANKERFKAYREANKEQKSEYNRAYRQKNKDRINEQRRARNARKKAEQVATIE